jgi:DNA-binding winged helix-turn-helix (wHTH) protein
MDETTVNSVYQAVARTERPSPAVVRVVLVLDVPAGSAELPTRTAQLADEFGSLVSHSIPGLRARKAVISTGGERARPPVGSPAPRRHGLIIDRASREVSVDGHRVRFTYREFELLSYLAGFPRRAVSRDELMREVWGEFTPETAVDASHRTVDTHVRRVRAKLGDHARALTTVRGLGYRFDPGPDVVYLAGAVRRPA